jgi:DNA-directed RNA polymerase subunit RPC12/RpoP
VDYKFITTCKKCGKEFTVFWAMDPNRIRPESIADITCPVCGKRFKQSPRDLLPYEARGSDFRCGHPVRTVEVAYDCPHCGNNAIFVSLVHTDMPWEDLSREAIQAAVCNYVACPRRGLPQKLNPTRIQLGALNPCWG